MNGSHAPALACIHSPEYETHQQTAGEGEEAVAAVTVSKLYDGGITKLVAPSAKKACDPSSNGPWAPIVFSP